MFLFLWRLKVNKVEKYNHSRPLHASTQGAAGTCTHLASYGVGALLSPQAQDFLNRLQAQCTPSRAVCMHTCFKRCFEFQPSITAADSSALFLLRVNFCLLIRGWKCSCTDGLNSMVAKIWRELFGFGAKIRFFLEKNPIHFCCLGWLVGWLRFGTTFSDVCHPKKTRVPLGFKVTNLYWIHPKTLFEIWLNA